MYTPIEESAIDNKIHEFMARKSPTKTFTKAIAERLNPTRLKKTASDITYERIEWHQSHAASHSFWQKAL